MSLPRTVSALRVPLSVSRGSSRMDEDELDALYQGSFTPDSDYGAGGDPFDDGFGEFDGEPPEMISGAHSSKGTASAGGTGTIGPAVSNSAGGVIESVIGLATFDAADEAFGKAILSCCIFCQSEPAEMHCKQR